MTATQPRPPAVTIACLFVGLGSLMLLVELFATLSNWGSLQVQGELRKTLKATPLPGLGVDEALHWLQVGAYVALAMSVAATVFAFFAALGDRASRIALTALCALAALAFLGGGFVGLLPAIVAVLSASALWSAEARAWFGGVQTEPQLSRGSVPAGSVPAEPVPARDPVPGWIPGEVLTGSLLAMVGCVVAGSVAGTNALAVLARRLAPEEFDRTFGKAPLLAESLYGVGSTPTTDAVVIGISTALALMAFAGFVLAVLLLFRRTWARRPLIVLASVSAVLSVLASPLGLVLTGIAVATVVLLKRPAARRWR